MRFDNTSCDCDDDNDGAEVGCKILGALAASSVLLPLLVDASVRAVDAGVESEFEFESEVALLPFLFREGVAGCGAEGLESEVLSTSATGGGSEIVGVVSVNKGTTAGTTCAAAGGLTSEEPITSPAVSATTTAATNAAMTVVDVNCCCSDGGVVRLATVTTGLPSVRSRGELGSGGSCQTGLLSGRAGLLTIAVWVDCSCGSVTE